MTDIHCHLLYGVDDGPETAEETYAALAEAKNQGIDTVILTPHYRKGMFPYERGPIIRHYMEVREAAKGLGLTILLGTEYHIDSDIVTNIRNSRCLTLAGSEYILAEYSYSTEYSYLRNTVQDLLFSGFVPVIAHAERYPCLRDDMDRTEEIRKMGVLIQINADAVLGLDGREAKRYCDGLIREGLADIIASDAHGMSYRPPHMDKCRQFVEKKYGAGEAERLFEANPQLILEGAK